MYGVVQSINTDASALGSVPPSTFYILFLLREAIYLSYGNVVKNTNDFFSLHKSVIKNSLLFSDFINEFKFYSVLVLASNLWLEEKNISLSCTCNKKSCICALTNYFFSTHGGFIKMFLEHLERARTSPINDPLQKYEKHYEENYENSLY